MIEVNLVGKSENRIWRCLHPWQSKDCRGKTIEQGSVTQLGLMHFSWMIKEKNSIPDARLAQPLFILVLGDELMDFNVHHN